MKYLSTRASASNTERKRFCEILLEGLAPDGGLYLPETYPQISATRLEELRQVYQTQGYADLAFEVLSLFMDDIPADVAEREKQIEMGRDDLAGKKEEMKEKIVAGRIGKRLKEMALMDQAYIKDSNLTVEEMVKQVAGKVGENIQVRRFVRFNLGEGIEVEKMDFAAEVAAMQAA